MRRALAALALVVGACSSDDADPEAEHALLAVEVTPVEGRPSAVAAGDGVLWVADDGRDVVYRVGTDDGLAVGDPVPVAPGPIALAVGEDGAVWVAHANGVVSHIAGDEVTTTQLGGTLVDLVVDGDDVWAGDIEAGMLVEVGSGARIVVPDGVVRLALDGDRMWVTGLDRTVTPVDLVLGAARTPVEVGAGPIGVAVADGVVWVANSDDDTVTRIDGDERTTTSVGDAPVAVVVEGDDVWVVNQDGRSVTRLGGGETDLALRPRGVALAARSLWAVGVDPSAVVQLGTG